MPIRITINGDFAEDDDDVFFATRRQSWSVIGLAASQNDDSEWLQMLLTHGANANQVRRGDGNCDDYNAGETAIFDAIHANSIRNVDLLIRAGADLNHQDNCGHTP